MQVSVEATSTIERRMIVGVPSEPVKSKIQDRLKSLVKKTKINGFRPGKVPMRLIKQMYEQKVRDEIVNELINATYKEAIEQEEITPIGNPTFSLNGDIDNLEEELSYTATFEVSPILDTLHVDELSVERLVAKITEADIDTMLHRFRQQRQTWNEISSPASEGDRITIDMVGTINGQPFKGNKIHQMLLILGQNNPILPGIEQKLLGVKKGEIRELDLILPENNTKPELANQTVRFVVTATQVDTPQLAEIDAEFLELFGVEDGKIETLRAEALGDMERQLEDAVKEKVKRQILDALLEANPVEAPRFFVENESQRLLEIRQQEWQMPNLNVDMFKEEATKRVKVGILVGELINMHNIQPSEEKVQQFVEKIASTYEDPDKMFKEIYADEKQLQEIKSVVIENQIVVWLLKRARVTERQVDFYTAMTENSTFKQVPTNE